MEETNELLTEVSGMLWGWPMIALLLGTHILLTIRLRFPQRHIFKAIRLSVQKDGNATGEVSQFGALATALAATIGTGNIVGVGTAIALGGPGAVLWCWLTGILGIATKYGEGLLAVKYRISSNGRMLGGPMYAIENGLANRTNTHFRWFWKLMAAAFAFFTALATFGIGSTVQANAISTLGYEVCGIPPVVIGGIVTILAAAVIMGGVKSIARGLFSNESGLGSAPIIAASAQTKNPVRQALVSSSATFWDTVIICALTGLAIVSSIVAYPDISASDGGVLTKMAFSKIPYIGEPLLAFGSLTFAFSTILGWGLYGERGIEYLADKFTLYCSKGQDAGFKERCTKKATNTYRVVFLITVYLGSVVSLDIVWNLADIFNALMAIPNLLCLLFLSGVLVSETRKYLWNNRLDEE